MQNKIAGEMFCSQQTYPIKNSPKAPVIYLQEQIRPRKKFNIHALNCLNFTIEWRQNKSDIQCGVEYLSNPETTVKRFRIYVRIKKKIYFVLQNFNKLILLNQSQNTLLRYPRVLGKNHFFDVIFCVRLQP